METGLVSINLKTSRVIGYETLIKRIEESDIKDQLTNTTKEVIKQLIGSGVIRKEAIEIIENCFGYRLVGCQNENAIYYFLKND